LRAQGFRCHVDRAVCLAINSRSPVPGSGLSCTQPVLSLGRPSDSERIKSRRSSMSSELRGKKIAILATDGFEQVELTEPRKALNNVGATTVVIAPKGGEIKGWNQKDWGQAVKVDLPLADANPHDYDALLLPGGVMNPDHLRMEPAAVNFVRQF